MCVFSPDPPKLPDPPVAPPKPERTAKAPIIGRKRTTASRTSASRRSIKRTGTSSLRIPLRSSGNLNY